MDALKLGAVFVVVLVLVAFRWQVGAVMLAGCALLVVAFGMSPDAVLGTVALTLTTWITWQLTISLASIVVMEHALREWGALRRMSAGLSGLVRDERIAMAALPALIGFLPSAGGARFSAPLVDEAAAGTNASPTLRSFMNYWFRHIWNYSLPIYGGVVLVSAVAAVPVGSVIAANFPLTTLALAVGVVIAFPRVRAIEPRGAARGLRAHLVDVVPALLPILAVLVAVLVFNVDLALTLVTATAAVVLVARTPAHEVLRLIRSRMTLRIVGMVVGVLLFRDFLQVSGAVRTVPATLAAIGVPFLFLAFALPFIVGLITALETAFVGLTFPLLLAVAGTSDLRLLAFAYAAGFGGVMLSPLHLCMVFTREYFETDYLPMLVPVGVGTLLVLAGAFAYLLLR